MENFNTHFQNYLGKSYTSVYFQNIDGMKTNFDEFILNYHKLHYDFDFVAFAETNIHYDEINQFSLNNSYNCQVLSKKLNKQKGSGIVLFYKRSLHFSIIDSLCRDNINYEMLGGKLKTDIGFIYIISVYRLHGSDTKLFCDEIEKIIISLDSPCLIFGDFNYNWFAYNNDKSITLKIL